MRAPRRTIAVSTLLVVTILSSVAVMWRLRLDPNVGSLLPDGGDAAALRRYVRAFGGGDLGTVMVRGEDPRRTADLCARITAALGARPTVEQAADRVKIPHSLDAMLVWRHAEPPAQARLAAALTPAVMRTRLMETRAALALPGSGALADAIVKDPLRLGQIVFAGTDLGAGVRARADGAFATDDGRMCLVLVKPRGQALRSADAFAFTADVESVLAPLRAEYPGVRFGVTGGHAIAAATETMLERDLKRSSVLALVLASVVFTLVFRRVRALVAVIPPLALGTLWTAGLATALPGGLSALAVAFMSVVVGVGVDTGVHVYAALLEARRRGLAPKDAARAARQQTAGAVLLAAGTAAAGFGALMLSDIRAIRQFGFLCAAGEVFTAIAIVAVTPEIGAWLERGPAPAALSARWTRAFAWLAGTRARAGLVGLLAIAPAAILVALGPPRVADAIVAIRPGGLEPLQVQREVLEAFGGAYGRLVVLVADADPERARTRGDRVAERLASVPDVGSIDALTAIAPTARTQRERLAARDALGLAAAADELERALRETGFTVERFAPALAAMRNPPGDVVDVATAGDGGSHSPAILLSRYLGVDEGETLVSIYVRPRDTPAAIERIETAVRAVDEHAVVTGYHRLEASLKASLRHDLPRIALVAGLLVVLALAAALRRARDVVIAVLVVTGEVAGVLLAFRLLHIPLHVYSALAIPVLLGITVDEAMFLLRRARAATGEHSDQATLLRRARAATDTHTIEATLRDEGPPIAATALTTAAGFGALAFCDFDGLRDLGLAGALGSTVGLLMALVVVPAGLRMFTRRGGNGSPA